MTDIEIYSLRYSELIQKPTFQLDDIQLHKVQSALEPEYISVKFGKYTKARHYIQLRVTTSSYKPIH